MQSKALLKAVLRTLDSLKAVQITPLDVRKMTSVTDHMVVASGTSNRHVQSIAEHLCTELKAKGMAPISFQGDTEGDWMLVDFGDVVVHVMHPRTRDFYNLEGLWSPMPTVQALFA